MDKLHEINSIPPIVRQQLKDWFEANIGRPYNVLYWCVKKDTEEVYNCIGYSVKQIKQYRLKKGKFGYRKGYIYFDMQCSVGKHMSTLIKTKSNMIGSRWKAKDKAYKIFCEKTGKEFYTLHQERNISEERRKELSDRLRVLNQVNRLKKYGTLTVKDREYPYLTECPFCENRIEIKDSSQRENPILCPKCDRQHIL